ncbi:MAG: hypothetical protein ABIN23_03070, partial [candidate division WOR-3 bacterium]
MEIAISILGVIAGLLGVLFTYVWRANGKTQKSILETQKSIMEMVNRSIELHKESIELHKESMEIIRQNHKDSMEALKG